MQLGRQLTQDQTEAGGANGSQCRQQHGKGLAGGHFPLEAEHLALSIAAIRLQPRSSSQVLSPSSTVMGVGGHHVHHCGSVFAGCTQKEDQTNRQQNSQQEGGLKSCRHGIPVVFNLLSLAPAESLSSRRTGGSPASCARVHQSLGFAACIGFKVQHARPSALGQRWV